MSICERYQSVQQALENACTQSGRRTEDVGLIGVSKKHSFDKIEAVANLGHVDFGENYAQELRDKAASANSLSHVVRWHFIGRIQRNKAKYIAPVAFRIHTLENTDQIDALLKRAPNGIDGLICVNIGRESQKAGVQPNQVVDLGKTLARIPNCRIHGLMCIPPFGNTPEDTVPFFQEMAELMKQGRQAGLPWRELSMGMSADFPLAIQHGATWIRVGTALFGPRV